MVPIKKENTCDIVAIFVLPSIKVQGLCKLGIQIIKLAILQDMLHGLRKLCISIINDLTGFLELNSEQIKELEKNNEKLNNHGFITFSVPDLTDIDRDTRGLSGFIETNFITEMHKQIECAFRLYRSEVNFRIKIYKDIIILIESIIKSIENDIIYFNTRLTSKYLGNLICYIKGYKKSAYKKENLYNNIIEEITQKIDESMKKSHLHVPNA